MTPLLLTSSTKVHGPPLGASVDTPVRSSRSLLLNSLQGPLHPLTFHIPSRSSFLRWPLCSPFSHRSFFPLTWLRCGRCVDLLHLAHHLYWSDGTPLPCLKTESHSVPAGPKAWWMTVRLDECRPDVSNSSAHLRKFTPSFTRCAFKLTIGSESAEIFRTVVSA